MNKKIIRTLLKMKFEKLAFFVIVFLFFSCSGSSSGGDNEVTLTPSNLTINSTLAGTSSSYPNGDGSGVVNFVVNAKDATSYKILIGTETITSTSGSFSYTFKGAGTNTYTIYVSAYNGSKFISGNTSVTVYVLPKLLWSDEFNGTGAPDSSKWGYDLGNNGGWGNNEAEYYTDRLENVNQSNGTLKINLLKESYAGYNYTSGRIKTQGKFSFKYGRIDIRAKLAGGGGTWPALWMLGDSVSSLGWPACGEIDNMEHVGNQLNKIFGTLHYPGHSGGSAVGGSTMISNATTEFHIYSVEWSSTAIKFYVDNTLYYTFNNDSSMPFNNNFFIIMNVAMGGGFGGTIDPNVSSATTEVDYVRVYQ